MTPEEGRDFTLAAALSHDFDRFYEDILPFISERLYEI